jgi:hypothetical protein
LVRELLPVGAAAGAAALAVTFIVGGTTAELVTPAPRGAWPVATSPSPTATPSVVTKAAAPRRGSQPRPAGFDLELAGGPVAIVTGSLAPAGRASRLGGDRARPARPAPVPGATAPAELAGPAPAFVAAPSPAAPVLASAAATPTGPGRSATAPGQARRASPTLRPGSDPAPSTFSAAGASTDDDVDPAEADDDVRGRGQGPESAPGQQRAADRASGPGRSQPR